MFYVVLRPLFMSRTCSFLSLSLVYSYGVYGVTSYIKHISGAAQRLGDNNISCSCRLIICESFRRVCVGPCKSNSTSSCMVGASSSNCQTFRCDRFTQFGIKFIHIKGVTHFIMTSAAVPILRVNQNVIIVVGSRITRCMYYHTFHYRYIHYNTMVTSVAICVWRLWRSPNSMSSCYRCH